MGSGKGSPEGWVAVVKPGRVMFELAGVPESLAREAMRLAGRKLPVKTKFVHARGARDDRPRSCATCRTTSSSSTSAPSGARLFGLRFQLATGELENTAGVGSAKRDLARALTVARERGLDPNTIR